MSDEEPEEDTTDWSQFVAVRKSYAGTKLVRGKYVLLCVRPGGDPMDGLDVLDLKILGPLSFRVPFDTASHWLIKASYLVGRMKPR